MRDIMPCSSQKSFCGPANPERADTCIKQLRLLWLHFARRQTHEDKIHQNRQDDGNQRRRDILHRLRNSAALKQRQPLGENHLRAGVVVTACGIRIDIIRDGFGIRRCDRILHASAVDDIEIAVPHVDDEHRAARIPEIINIRIPRPFRRR